MITMPLSTLASISASFSSTIRRTQSEMSRIQTEVASGRKADTGQDLGSATVLLVSFRQEVSVLGSAIDSNGQVAGRLVATQNAMTSIVAFAQSALQSVIAARSDPQAREVAIEQARGTLKSFIETANTSYSGSYVFSGMSTQTAPFSDYYATPPAASRTSIENAFVGEFGVGLADPSVENISASSMQAFLDNAYASLFDDTSWSTNWTSATTQGALSRISVTQTVEIPITAQAQAFRDIAQSLALVADVGASEINDSAFDTVVDQASKGLSKGIALMGVAQADVGVVQKQVSDASDRMSLRKDLVSQHVSDAEGVDFTALSVRLNTLMSQLEASYAITGRLQQLSLLNAI
ncbi:MAG: flagellar hook-associated family protein [Hyphomicrobiaceae bacterium]